ncbi:hypothetical protein E4T52_12861 [Aureobasidium sp. EXF-3400]|nr:hypothetical protein E4T51_11768 [Aureobasidium sp. EXF-12344]KAI4772145.1 hypothetical protein E4T52_12861 [Aureobasidium sp. EXF-3400]
MNSYDDLFDFEWNGDLPEDYYTNLDLGLERDFNLNSPLEASASSRPAPTGIGQVGYYPISHRVGSWSPVPVPPREGPCPVEGCSFYVPEASVSDEEVSEEETDSDEDVLRPSQRAEKKPVGACGAAGSGQGEGERASSEGVPIADTPEEQPEQEEEEDEEYVEDDDEYAPAAAPARPVRRVAGGQQPARISVAPAPAINSRKATAWSAAEDAACIKLMKEVCTLAQYAAIAGTEKRFEVVADRMQREAGFVRTASGVKLQWNRRLRLASKFEDRGEKKRASGLTTSALGQGTKRGTLAVTSLVATPSSSGTNSSSSPAQSTETSNLPSSRNGKRKAITIDSDDDEDDDFVSAPRPSKPAKRVRSTSVASSSAVPSTQDVAYYDLSTENIITGSRASRHRRAPTVEASSAVSPTRSSRQKPTTNDDNDDEQEIIPPPKPSTRSSLLKRARTINDDDEDEEPSTAPPQPKRSKVSDEQSNSDTQPKRKRMANFDPVNKYSKKDGRLLDKKKKSDYIEWINPAMHDQRPITPEPAYNTKAYWEKLLRDRQAALAKQREEAERQRQAQEEEDEEDEDPIMTTADKAKKNRELRRQRLNAAMEKSLSTAKSPSPVKPSSTTKPSSTATTSSSINPIPATRPLSSNRFSSTATTASINNPFSVSGPFSASILASAKRPSAVVTRPAPSTSTSPYTRPSLTGRTSPTVEPSSFRRTTWTGRPFGSTIDRSNNRTSMTDRPLGTIDHRATRPSSTTSSSIINNDHSSTQPDRHNQQPSSSSSGRWQPPRRGLHAELSPITEQSEDALDILEHINHQNEMNAYRANLLQRDAAATAQVATDATAAQVATDEELARQLHEEMNGPPSRSRRGRGFR